MPGGVGNGGLVVRAGDAVRRPVGPQTPAVEALLRHLQAKGFEGAPRHLGYDERGREVLTYVPGYVPAWDDPPAWLSGDDVLVSVLTLMRRLHDATTDFEPPPDATWAWPPPPHRRGDVSGHNDACRENVVFDGRRATALIDFDFAGPATRAWDVAGVVRHFVLGLPVLDRLEWGLAMVVPRAARGDAGLREAGRERHRRTQRRAARDRQVPGQSGDVVTQVRCCVARVSTT